MKFFALQANRHIGDLFQDIRDGHNLITLLEVLSSEHLVSMNTFNNSNTSRKKSGFVPPLEKL